MKSIEEKVAYWCQRALSAEANNIVACEERDRAEEQLAKYKDALHYLRRNIDGYDSTFEFCGVEDFKDGP